MVIGADDSELRDGRTTRLREVQPCSD
jgi:hypothetical protein